MRRITFKNQRGQTLVGDLHGDPTDAMVISCHGMLSDRRGAKHVLLCERMAQAGIGSLRFDFAGRGESEGDLMELSYSGEVRDLLAAVEHLAGLGMRRCGVFGSSMGGAVALLSAAREQRIAAVATIAAVAHPGEVESRYPEACAGWRERGYIDLHGARLGSGFLEDAAQHDVASATSILTAPVLVLHGTEDTVVPLTDAHDIASAARNVSLHIVDGANHRFSDPVHMRPAMGMIADFFTQTLGGE